MSPFSSLCLQTRGLESTEQQQLWGVSYITGQTLQIKKFSKGQSTTANFRVRWLKVWYYKKIWHRSSSQSFLQLWWSWSGCTCTFTHAVVFWTILSQTCLNSSWKVSAAILEDDPQWQRSFHAVEGLPKYLTPGLKEDYELREGFPAIGTQPLFSHPSLAKFLLIMEKKKKTNPQTWHRGWGIKQINQSIKERCNDNATTTTLHKSKLTDKWQLEKLYFFQHLSLP